MASRSALRSAALKAKQRRYLQRMVETEETTLIHEYSLCSNHVLRVEQIRPISATSSLLLLKTLLACRLLALALLLAGDVESSQLHLLSLIGSTEVGDRVLSVAEHEVAITIIRCHGRTDLGVITRLAGALFVNLA